MESLITGASEKFRVLNISYRYNWEKFEGARTPENMKQVFPLGNTEDFRCTLLEREVLSVHEKILVLTGTIHAFTSYRFLIMIILLLVLYVMRIVFRKFAVR